MTTINRQWQLASRPTGEPTAANFRLVEAPVPELKDGEVLVRHHFMSLDPYMRGRMKLVFISIVTTLGLVGWPG